MAAKTAPADAERRAAPFAPPRPTARLSALSRLGRRGGRRARPPCCWSARREPAAERLATCLRASARAGPQAIAPLPPRVVVDAEETAGQDARCRGGARAHRRPRPAQCAHRQPRAQSRRHDRLDQNGDAGQRRRRQSRRRIADRSRQEKVAAAAAAAPTAAAADAAPPALPTPPPPRLAEPCARTGIAAHRRYREPPPPGQTGAAAAGPRCRRCASPREPCRAQPAKIEYGVDLGGASTSRRCAANGRR